MSAKPPQKLNSYASDMQMVRDKTSYGIIPTPPSPTHPSPSLMSSTSNSSCSPPEPATPPHLRPRYPNLGRVPLHRRGTSKTYERLEDLLKEAGYKETRVFTPETERSDSSDARANHDNRLSVRDGMEAVVGFFAGLLPGAMTSKTSLEPPPESGGSGPAQVTALLQAYSPPVSPLTNRALQRQGIGGGYDLTEPPTPTTMSSSVESLGEPTPRLNRRHHDPSSASTVNPYAPRTYHSQRPHLPHRTSSQLSGTSQQMHQQSSRSSLHHQAIQHHSNIVSPRPSRPGAYIRHMTSASSMPPRPNSTPAHMSRPTILVNDNDISSIHTLPIKLEGEDSDPPPLPPSWLKSVARAVLFGGTGAYIGGPSNNFISHESLLHASSRSAKSQDLRTTRSSLSQVSSRTYKYQRQSTNRRSGLSDQTNTPTMSSRSACLVPPSLFSQIERGRSGRSEGEVSRTRVVCRSAPGSRNGSVTRGGDDRKERRRQREINFRKREEKGRLPSLARTRAEGDIWDLGKSEARSRGNNGGPNRYLSPWDADTDSEAGPSASSEEEDGELDLARILVPPKRQKSIRSLRRHLASEAGSGPSAHATRASFTGRRAGRGMNIAGVGGDGSGLKPSRVPSILQRRRTDEDWDGESQEEWGGGWVRKGAGNRESEDDDVESFVGFFGEGRTSLAGASKSATGRNRLGFNGGWGLMGGNGS